MRQVKAFLFLLLSLSIFGCAEDQPPRQVTRSFYYWRSSFSLSPAEHKALSELSVQHLYTKFFDVVWDDVENTPKPVAAIRFTQPPPPGTIITPVVFITNETFTQLNAAGADSLAFNVTKFIKSLSDKEGITLSTEIQIDCDWTVGTKNRYFKFLTTLRQHPYLNGKKLSATIRLHQVKYSHSTGIPPVDKGLLMCYNMGNLRNPKTKNSIIDTEELSRYIKPLRSYPLTLDIALPLFDWAVLFSENEYKGLIRNYGLQGIQINKQRIIFDKDTILNGTALKKGDWIRYEDSNPSTVKEAAQIIRKNLSYKNHNIILYHLDEHNLSKYKPHELENIYNSFH